MSPDIETIQKLFTFFSQKNESAIRNLFHKKIEWRQMEGFPNGGTYIGADDIFEFVFIPFAIKWKDWKAITTEYLDASGGTVIVKGYYEGIYISTGRFMQSQFAHFYSLVDGEITSFTQYTDTFKVAEAMGLTISGQRDLRI